MSESEGVPMQQQQQGGVSRRRCDLVKLAEAIAGRHPVRGLDHDDLVSEAYLAMVAAPCHYSWAQLHQRGLGRLLRVAERESRLEAAFGCRLPRQAEGPRCDAPAFGEDVRELLRRLLPKSEAGVMLALFVDEQSVAQVAQALGLTAARVHQIRQAALARLRRHFGVMSREEPEQDGGVETCETVPCG